MPKPKTRANGTGTVYKRGKTWTAEVVVGYKPGEAGKLRPIRITKGGYKTKSAALAGIPSLKSGGRQSTKNNYVTLNSLWLSYSKTKLPELSKDKQSHYRTARKKIDDIAYIDITLLRIDDLQDVVFAEAPTYYPAKDIKTLLMHLYDRAVAEQVVATNLAQYITLPRLQETATIPFNTDEVVMLWEGWESGDVMCGYALLMIYTGMMPGELHRLTVDMIKWDDQVIVGCGIKTKVRKNTPVILPDIILPVLRKLSEQSKRGKILTHSKDDFCAEFKEMIVRYGMRRELRPYSCRHTTGTTLAEAKTPLLTIKDVMRHSKAATTQRYVHMDPANLIRAANSAYNKESTPNILPTSKT